MVPVAGLEPARRFLHRILSATRLPIPSHRHILLKRIVSRERRFFMVGEDGFEPSKSLTTDLQSAPFGRSGTPPCIK